jgi:hypothetical protein
LWENTRRRTISAAIAAEAAEAQEAGVRVGSIICIGATLLAMAGPASAQFGVPFGGPGMLAAPEAVSGAIGAGAAHSSAQQQQQQQCQQVFAGREGPRTVCSPSQSSGPTPHR